MRKASRSRNSTVKEAAKLAIQRIQSRQESPQDDGNTDPDDPFGGGLSDESFGASDAARGSAGFGGFPFEEEGANSLAGGGAFQGDWSQIELLLPNAPAEGGFSPDPSSDGSIDWESKPIRSNGVD